MRATHSARTRLVLLFGIAVAACVTLAEVPKAAAQPSRAAQPPATSAEREVLVLNKSKRTVNELYVSPSNANQWGDDRLGDSTIEPGKTYRAKLGRIRDCEFDVQVVYDDASHEENRKVNLCRTRQLTFDGSNAVAASSETGAEHIVTLLNRSPRPIQQVFISAADSTQWGDDRLGDDSISVGERTTINYRGECSADLRVIFDNKGAEERRGVDICATPTISIEPGWTTADTVASPGSASRQPSDPLLSAPPLSGPPSSGRTSPTAPAPGAPLPGAPPSGNSSTRRTETAPSAAPTLSISIRNRSGHEATELYIFPEGRSDRGRDQLGLNTLPDGGQLTVSVDPNSGCRFAAHVVFSGKAPDQDMTGLDACHSSEVVLAGH